MWPFYLNKKILCTCPSLSVWHFPFKNVLIYLKSYLNNWHHIKNIKMVFKKIKEQNLSRVSWTSLWYVTIIYSISTAVSPRVELKKVEGQGLRETTDQCIVRGWWKSWWMVRQKWSVLLGMCRCSRGRHCSALH